MFRQDPYYIRSVLSLRINHIPLSTRFSDQRNKSHQPGIYYPPRGFLVPFLKGLGKGLHILVKTSDRNPELGLDLESYHDV
jgi:hypothetical protein